MILQQKIETVPTWSKNEINRWADYIELLCLYNADHLISRDDILDRFLDGDTEELSRGESEHSAEYDKLDAVVGNYYEIIEYRKNCHPEYYPFYIEDRQCITLKTDLSIKQMHYIFLLLCSSIRFMDGSSLQKMTHMFEKYCHPIMRFLMPVKAQTELFGTTRVGSIFTGNLRTRIAKLADLLGAQTTKSMDSNERYDRVHAGDAGLDIVSYVKLDNSSHIPFALGQCACSYVEWKNKQYSISSDEWRARIDPMAPFWQYMFVPFSCHNAAGKFEEVTEIHTCLIDRQRILSILDMEENLFAETGTLGIAALLREVW